MRHPAIKGIFFLSVFMLLPACVSSRVLETTNEFTAIERDAKILLIEPDVELSMLKASGLSETRADWSDEGKKMVLAEISRQLGGQGHDLVEYEIDPASDRELQLVKLHAAVGDMIYVHRILGEPLPTKKNLFDWSLGPGVQALAPEEEADYALFLFARGQYASAGRQALAVGVFVLGGLASTGGQAAYASLVDMTSGDIVWFNISSTGPGTDMRKPEGAKQLVDGVLKGIPLAEEGA